jgi:2-oxoglutarate ferredoxin oxidoreductase subunit alpha
MNKVLMAGNMAIVEAAIQAGCRFYAGYPITPQNEIPEYMSRLMPSAGGTFIQAESELAAVNMVFGAAAAGLRAMTSSSSPGVSLKQEGISFLAGAELPAVIVNVQRGGPGLGNISGSQADYFQATRGGGHGDYRTMVLAPSSVQEMWDLTMLAFDKADVYRNPVLLLADGVLGQMMEPLVKTPYEAPDLPPKSWALTGAVGRAPNVIKSLYMGEGELERKNEELQEKYRRMRESEVSFEAVDTEDAELVVVSYGIAARVALSAQMALRKEGLRVGLFRPITLYPFPERELAGLASGGRRFMVVELSAGQMVEDVRLAVNGAAPVVLYGRPGGAIMTPEEVAGKLREALGVSPPTRVSALS